MTETEKLAAPSEELAAAILSPMLPGLRSVSRTPEGVSTYVSRAETEAGAFYARFLPEDATFGVEVTAQRLLRERGVPVPEVICYLPREPVTGRSLMVEKELPGKSLSADLPEDSWKTILQEAASALAVLHSIPVEGFGWVDRTSEEVLKGETPDFDRWFTAETGPGLAALETCGFPADKAARVRALTAEARTALRRDRAVLVHGDFSMDHIFHENGHFTGFIDFGEIRGATPCFDLGDFLQSDETPGYSAAEVLLEAYGKHVPMGGRERRAVKLMALTFDLGFVGKKAGSPAQSFWLDRLSAMLDLL